MKFSKFKLALISALAVLALPFGYVLATSPISSGGSIFPLTLISQPLNNSVDEFNQWLILANQQLVGVSTLYPGAMTVPTSGVDTSGVAFSSTIQQNPLQQESSTSVLVSGVGGATTGLDTNTAVTLIASQTGRSIIPGGGIVIMASGTAATATSVALECSDGTLVAKWPIADLISATPIGTGLYLSTLGTIVTGAGLANGCASGKSLLLSNVGSTLTTTSQIKINVPYTVQ